MKTSFLTTGLLITFISCLSSCGCDCDDEPTPSPTLLPICTIDSLKYELLDNAGMTPLVTASDSIKKEAFGMRLSFLSDEPTCSHHQPRFSFFPSAYAYFPRDCDCFHPIPRVIEQVSAFEIIALKDFDEDHKAGSAVTSKFRKFRQNSLSKINLEDFSTFSYFDLLLIESPDSSHQQQFAISVTVSDSLLSKTITDTTESFYLY